MEKIKSSREIALERAARIQTEPQEEPAMRESRQYLQAAQILARLYLDGGKEPAELAEAVNRYPKQVRREAKMVLLEATITALELENVPRVAALVELFQKNETGRRFTAALSDLQRRYRECLEQNRKDLMPHGQRAGLVQLRQAGISGSAIAGINLERSSWWRQAVANATLPLKEELDRLQKEMPAAFRTVV